MNQRPEDLNVTSGTPFTPRMPSGRRLTKVTHSDVELISGSLTLRGLGHQAVVKLKGRNHKGTYNLIGTDCGIGSACACDARLERVEAAA